MTRTDLIFWVCMTLRNQFELLRSPSTNNYRAARKELHQLHQAHVLAAIGAKEFGILLSAERNWWGWVQLFILGRIVSDIRFPGLGIWRIRQRAPIQAPSTGWAPSEILVMRNSSTAWSMYHLAYAHLSSPRERMSDTMRSRMENWN